MPWRVIGFLILLKRLNHFKIVYRLLWIILLVFSSGGFCQHYNFKAFTVSDGLAQSQVRDICQDQHGYLWIGTASGLSRFDGIEFVNYSIDDGLPDNNISDLFVEDNGSLWVSTAGGVALFKDQKVETFNFEDPYRIKQISTFKNEVYFATNTGLITLENKQFKKVGSNDFERNLFLRSIVNYQDSLLFCGGKEGVYVWNGNSFVDVEIPNYDELNVRGLSIQNNKLYISARKVGLIIYNLEKNEVEKVDLNYTTVSTVGFYEDKVYGISTNSGAFLLEDEQVTYFDSRNGLMNSGLSCVYIDSEGNLWIGTDGRGLLKFSGTAVVSYTVNDGLGSNLVLAIAEDKNGEFIFGTYDAGLTRFDNGKSTVYNAKNKSLVENTIWAIRTDEDEGEIWLGTSQGLTVLNQDYELVDDIYKGFQKKIRTILELENGTILMGGDEGLVVVEGDTVFTAAEDLNLNKIYQINHTIYFATSEGLYSSSINEGYNNYERISLPENKIYSLTSDRFNNLWIGTENGLFIRFGNGKIVALPLDARDYRSKNILGLITSQDGDIWICGMKGVYQVKYDESSANNIRILNYGTPEGILNEESNINAIYEDRNNRIWIGTASGLVRIDPKLSDDLFNCKEPMLHLTGVRLFMEEIVYEDYETILDSTFDVPLEIELPFNKNHLTFDFIGINLKDPRSVLYEYRLLGADEQWSPLSRTNYATYSFLQPGSYTFQVRAKNKNEDWSSIQSMRVVITPPFWKTWWFIFLVSVGVILILTYFFQARIRTIKQQEDNEKLALRNRLLFLEQRSLNASMNRHFIFNSLNSIQYFINSSDKLSANKFLSNFAKLIRKNLDSSAANNFIVTLQEEIERIELYLSLEKMRFSNKFEYEVTVSPSLDTESIEIPSMILQPFVENSIIHGVLSLERKGKINVEIHQEFGEVVFEVTDNGLGIDNSLKHKSNEHKGDHESQGMEITNRRIEILRKLTGENLLIVGPFQMNDEEGNSIGTKVILKLGGTRKFE